MLTPVGVPHVPGKDVFIQRQSLSLSSHDKCISLRRFTQDRGIPRESTKDIYIGSLLQQSEHFECDKLRYEQSIVHWANISTVQSLAGALLTMIGGSKSRNLRDHVFDGVKWNP